MRCWQWNNQLLLFSNKNKKTHIRTPKVELNCTKCHYEAVKTDKPISPQCQINMSVQILCPNMHI